MTYAMITDAARSNNCVSKGTKKQMMAIAQQHTAPTYSDLSCNAPPAINTLIAYKQRMMG